MTQTINTQRSENNSPVNGNVPIESFESEGSYIITQDLPSIAQALCATLNAPSDQRKNVEAAADKWWRAMVNVLQAQIPNVKSYDERFIQEQLLARVSAMLEDDPDIELLCLDRFLLSDVPEDILLKISRLSISRMEDGSKAPRQGAASITKQLTELSAKLRGKRVVCIDDGVFSGGTFKYLLPLLRSVGIEIQKILVFLANNGLDEIEKVPVESIQRMNKPLDWIDSRDLTLFAGRCVARSTTGTITTARPYFAPFSDGKPSSLNNGSLIPISQSLLAAQAAFLRDMERILGRSITMDDALRAGFPIPLAEEIELKMLKTRNTSLSEITAAAQKSLIRQTRMRITSAFVDMDGTLYHLDGLKGGFSGSSLEMQVNENLCKYIYLKENCDLEQAQELIREAKSDTIGPSNFFAKRYSIDRAEFFDEVWGPLDVSALVKKNEDVIATMNSMRKKDICLILLTSAPAVWAEKVIQWLGLQSTFNVKFTAEKFRSKAEVFERFAKNGNTSNMLSVGDQWETDIEPAARLGMQTLLVSPGRSLSYLSSLLPYDSTDC